MVHILRIDTTNYCLVQELIEATINSNTLPEMKFKVFGNDEFVDYIYGVLKFLGVKAFMINPNIVQQHGEQDSLIVFKKESDGIIN